MINIIAPNIKSGGGLEILVYLLDQLENNYDRLDVKVYIDISLKYKIISTTRREVIVMDSVLKKLKLFSRRIDNSLYFGNLPPLVKSKKSMVYFHNSYLLANMNELMKSSFSFFIKYSLQQIYIRYFIKNVDFVGCQTKYIKNKFMTKYKCENVKLLPFFQCCDKKMEEKLFDFCYISLAHPHKNHSLLLNAIELISKKNIKLSCVVTIEDDKSELLEQIERINRDGICNIVNVGIVPKSKVCEIYNQSKCLIFPSLKESFGLPLIEAVELGLDVIAIDLNYVNEVIRPSLVFQNNEKDLVKQIENYHKKERVQKSIAIIDNKVDDLIAYFIS